MDSTLRLALLILLSSAAVECQDYVDTTVTLPHGGQLLGKRIVFNNSDVDVFLDIPFAKPPVGPLRFKKPQPADNWSGVKDVRSPRSPWCIQENIWKNFDPSAEPVVGTEDCLYLDISVPGGVDSSSSKPVMVWIHGGGYFEGSKDLYIGTALASFGDVIVVVINYRLGALGFLTDGKGGGNFGLWDQRQALLWVKENIASFGGDPDMVTIFGESAGGGSVSSQVMGRHNDGLFKRAIQQSGSLYTNWGWYLSDNEAYYLREGLKTYLNCTEEVIYDCLMYLSAEDVFALAPIDQEAGSPYHPVPDDDFFPLNITDETYDLSKRFDLLLGYNTDEVNILLYQFASLEANVSLEDGLTKELIRQIFTTLICPAETPLSVGLCAEYLLNLHDLETGEDNIDRAIRTLETLTELSFSADIIRQLIYHSGSDSKSTYGYHFTEQVTGEDYSGLSLPSWIESRNHTADHADDLRFVFGHIYLKEEQAWKHYIPYEVSSYHVGVDAINKTEETEKPLSDVIMTAWTNFAKTGNPNTPVTIPHGAPTWPEFDGTNEKLMELNTNNLQINTYPYKQEIKNMITNYFPARAYQNAADSYEVYYEECPADDERKPTSDNSGHIFPSSALIALLIIVLLW